MAAKEKCLACGAPVEKTFSNCPQCGCQLKRCAKCKQLLKPLTDQCEKCGRAGVLIGGLRAKDARSTLWKKRKKASEPDTIHIPSPVRNTARAPSPVQPPPDPDTIKVGGPTEPLSSGSRVDQDQLSRIKEGLMQSRSSEIRAVDDVQRIHRVNGGAGENTIVAQDSVVKATITQNHYHQTRHSYRWIVEREMPEQGGLDSLIVYSSQEQARYVGKLIPLPVRHRYAIESVINAIPTPGANLVDYYDRLVQSTDLAFNSDSLQRAHERDPCLVLLRRYVNLPCLNEVHDPQDWMMTAKLIRNVGQCLAERGGEASGISPSNLFYNPENVSDFLITDFRIKEVKKRIADMNQQYAVALEAMENENIFLDVDRDLPENLKDVAALGLMLLRMMAGQSGFFSWYETGEVLSGSEQESDLVDIALNAMEGGIADVEFFCNQIGSVLRNAAGGEDELEKPFFQNMFGGFDDEIEELIL